MTNDEPQVGADPDRRPSSLFPSPQADNPEVN